MTKHGTEDSTAIPQAHCIETGPETAPDNPYGYTIHFEEGLTGQKLLTVLQAFWTIDGIVTVCMDDAQGTRISTMLHPKTHSRRVLQELRKTFRTATRLTGVAAFRPCNCERCTAEQVTWLGIRVIDLASQELIDGTASLLRSYPSVISVATRGLDTFVIKISVRDFTMPITEFTRDLTGVAKLHLEIARHDYALRFFAWAGPKSPHDW